MALELTNKLARRLITVTLNPVLDRTLWVKNFTAGQTFLVDKTEEVAGGKGVNVSRALRRFGIDSIATGIMAEGGNNPYVQLLNRDGITHDFVRTRGILRINITIVSDSKTGETHLRDRGPEIEQSILNDLEKKLKQLKGKNSFFVLSGSVPHGLPENIYRRLITTLKQWGCKVFFDASGIPLKEGISARPFFIKPNGQETCEMLGFLPESRTELVKAVHTFSGLGIKNIMISLGRRGLVLFQGEEAVHANVRVKRPVNRVGSGDASLAGGIIGILSELNTEETARLACAMGAANTLISGACVFNTEDVFRLFEETRVRIL